jgi:hypothetical protein
MKFADFYKEIRTYFVSFTAEYDRFRVTPGGIKGKLVFLLKNEKVKSALHKLREGVVLDKLSVKPRVLPESDWRKDVTALNPKSKLFTQLSAKAKVTKTKRSGRCVVATQKILPGELIIYEKPYAVMLYPEFTEQHCQLCFKELGEAATNIPCQKCQKVTL